MLYRKRLISQENFCIKQNLGNEVPSIEELRDMLHSDNYSQFIWKLVYYAKNITGTNSYWYQVKEQLKETLQQVGSLTIFWTLSYAEYHWPEFHALFGDDIHSEQNFRNNVVKNPHILDCFSLKELNHLSSISCIMMNELQNIKLL